MQRYPIRNDVGERNGGDGRLQARLSDGARQRLVLEGRAQDEVTDEQVARLRLLRQLALHWRSDHEGVRDVVTPGARLSGRRELAGAEDRVRDGVVQRGGHL